MTDVLIRSGTPIHRHRRMLPGKVPERAGNDRSPGRGAKTADQKVREEQKVDSPS